MTAPRVHCLGTLVLDRILELDRLPGADDKAFVKARREAAGGPARNVAAALAAWGDAVSLASAVGDDAVGRGLVARLEAAGIGTKAIAVVPGLATAETVILVDGRGERAIIIDPVPEAVLAAIGSGLSVSAGDAVVTNLFHATSAADALRAAREAGATALVDLEWPEIDRFGWEAAEAAAREADIVATNSQVLRAFAERMGIDADAEAAWRLADRLQPAGGKVCVTLGAAGVLARDGARRIELPALPVRPRDTTGAGDRFLAALAHATLAGSGFELAVAQAVAAAGLFLSGEPHGWDDVLAAAASVGA